MSTTTEKPNPENTPATEDTENVVCGGTDEGQGTSAVLDPKKPELNDAEQQKLMSSKNALMEVLLDPNNKINSTARRRLLVHVEAIVSQAYVAIGRARAAEALVPKVVDEACKRWKAETIEERATQVANAVSLPVESKKPRDARPRVTFADVTKTKPQAKTAKFVTTIYPKAQEESLKTAEDTRELIKATIRNPLEMGIKVKNMRRVPGKGVQIEVDSEESVAKLKSKLNLEAIEIRDVGKRLPKVMAYAAPKDLTVDQIKEALKQSGLDDGPIARTRIIFASNKGQEANICLEVDPEVRKKLIAEGRLYIGWNCIRVKDFVVVTRCFKCQRFGHIARHCQDAKDTCSICAQEGHKNGECPNKEQSRKCANCIRSKLGSNHDVRSERCPLHERAMQMLLSNTDYGS
ncbi:unnamed protein product [Nesidiocoris tenuis]|uniref:CCHC-type domain-containing protein n=1 Tax=Nesidiocoris tenuis TaxID=355587 RepID=A0A6H5GZ56_9HEMI|nr:unnamed protein product [Nesidiocoris tenuis]